MSQLSPFLNDREISWASLFKQFFQSNNFKKAIDNRLKKLTDPSPNKNFLYKPFNGTYELELTSITERQWQLIHALTLLPPSRYTKRKPRNGYEIPPLTTILVR